MNKEQQEQEKLFIKQSKLASMGEMISLIAHQWRQPLSAINGTVLRMDMDDMKKILDRERLEKYLNRIEDLTAYLSNTINDFTDFFSIDKEKETFFISDIIQQTIHLTVIPNSKNIKLNYRKQNHFEIRTYRSELIQSILILINNSIYACNKNLKNITSGVINIDTYILGKYVFISVEDNGGGIDSKSSKKIFDPYFTTKKEQGGTGLGLYILKLIVEDSINGKVFFQNSAKGAIFTIKIPIK
jgi:signal transduction histidine kinase